MMKACHAGRCGRSSTGMPQEMEKAHLTYTSKCLNDKENPATGKEELLVIYVISFHEDE